MNPRERFCPNLACPARGRVGERNIVIHSQKEKRYKCKERCKTFVERSGTAFYRLHHNEELMTVVIVLLANGCPPQAIVAAYGLDERTVANWQEAFQRYEATSGTLVLMTTINCGATHVAHQSKNCQKLPRSTRWIVLPG